jgi:rabenosyn-5
MAARKLGGGRILGSGKSLAPAAPSPAAHRLSHTESTLSISSDVSTPSGLSPLATPPLVPENLAQGPDLNDRVDLENGSSGPAVNAASTRLVCPICNEEMVGPRDNWGCGG